jgi:hypothetical protein
MVLPTEEKWSLVYEFFPYHHQPASKIVRNRKLQAVKKKNEDC